MEEKIKQREKTLEERILKIYVGDKWLKIASWNLQSLNGDINRRYQKLEFIRDTLNENPCDLVWLIDVNDKNNCLILNGYTRFTDERSILFVKNNIKLEFEVSRNIIYNEFSKLAFVYITPNNRDEVLINKFIYLINEGYILCGDINLKSNRKLWPYINAFHGEDSLQTGFLTNKVVKLITKTGPSDHKLICGYLKCRVKFNFGLKVSQFDIEHCEKCVEDILNGRVPKYKPKVSIRRSYVSLNDRETAINAMMNDYINKDIRKIYKRYNYLWTGDRREPFLGMTVPDVVMNSFAEHLHEKSNKEYIDLNLEKLPEKFLDNISTKKTKSSALNADFLQLNSICDSIKKIIKNENYDRKMLFPNIVKIANIMKRDINAQTFFLVKNSKLQDFNDVRVIIIIPTIVKIYEAVVYDEIVQYFKHYFGNRDEYQFGALPGKSTYLGMAKLRYDYENRNANAIVFYDISKGYDCIDPDILEEQINKNIDDETVKSLLHNWSLLIRNMNYVINGQKIKRTRGIAMGLSLSPIVFIFYVDCCIKSYDKSILTMFIDDLAMCKPGEMSTNTFKELNDNLVKDFAKFKLIINPRKTGLMTKEEEIKEKFKEYKVINTEKYLGRLIGITSDGRVINDDRWYNTKAFRSRNIPYWASFFVKKLIFNACIDARVRYRFMMWACNDIKIRDALWRNTWFFLKSNFAKFSYLEVSFSMVNVFRYCIDGHDIRVWENRLQNGEFEEVIKKEIKERLYITNENPDVYINKAITAMDFDVEFKGDNYFQKCANFCNNLFNIFKKQMLAKYHWKQKFDEKVIDREVFPRLEEFCNSPLYGHFGFLHSIVFKHVEVKKRFKQILVSVLMNALAPITNLWNNFIENKSMPFFEVISILDVVEDVIKKGDNNFQKLLILKKEDWEKVIIQLYKNCWYVIPALLDIVDFTKSKVKDEDNIEWDKLQNAVYVDGSYAGNKGGYGIYFDKPCLGEFSRAVPNNLLYLRNVAGELLASIEALEIAKQHKVKEINLVYDYIGIPKYLEEEWSTQDSNIKEIIVKYRNLKKSVKVNFVKVPSHTNNLGNTKADMLAKLGAGIEIKKDPECKVTKEQRQYWRNIYKEIFKIFTALELILYNNNINDYNLEQLVMALKMKTFGISELGEKIFKLTEYDDLDSINPACIDVLF